MFWQKEPKEHVRFTATFSLSGFVQLIKITNQYSKMPVWFREALVAHSSWGSACRFSCDLMEASCLRA